MKNGLTSIVMCRREGDISAIDEIKRTTAFSDVFISGDKVKVSSLGPRNMWM